MSDEALSLFDAVYECVAIQTDETVRCWERTSSAEVEAFVKMLCTASTIIFAAPGRTSHILAASAPRFVDLGATVTLAQEKGRLSVGPEATIVVACPSGSTTWIKTFVEKAKTAGAKLAVCTGRRDSAIAKIADAVLWIDAFSPGNGKPPASQQRAGALFDQALFMVLEAIAEMLEQRRSVQP